MICAYLYYRFALFQQVKGPESASDVANSKSAKIPFMSFSCHQTLMIEDHTANFIQAAAPGLRLLYRRDAKAAIAWMEKAVGFVPLNIMPGEGDAIAHSELKLGSSMYMAHP